MSKGYFITTPIYYVNGKPHIGHAYTTIAADALARWQRLKGRPTFFLTGTDEHGQKVADKAAERGMSPQAHCDDMVTHWKAAWEKFDIQFDRFMRTTDPAHTSVVQAVLQKLFDAEEIYLDTYTGWYSVAAERFWTEKDLVDGKCPDTGQPVQEITESNYFFKMSKYQQQLIDHIEANPEFIRPTSRRNEVLGFLRGELGDLCISRPKERLSWGIEIPFDDRYVTYVWFDALLNYLSMVGYHPDNDQSATWWPADVQLLGKDILTTHAVYWSTMLLALDVPLPTSLYAHGWWTSKGTKMSKSLGNVIDVHLLADEFGVDPTRYFFLREISFGADGGFSYDGFMTRYNADLANDLGNLAHRGLSMTNNWLGGVVPPVGERTELEADLLAVAAKAVAGFDEHFEDLQFNKALDSLWDLVRAGNKYVDVTQPWALNKQGNVPRLQTVQRHVLEICAIAGTLLQAVMPTRSAELLRRLGASQEHSAEWLNRLLSDGPSLDLLPDGQAIDVCDPLFPRFRKLPEKIAEMMAAEAPPPAPKKKKKQAKKAPEPPAEIAYEDFAKVLLKVGEVKSAEKHPNADRLLVLTVDIGEENPRTICAGIADKYAPADLVGRKVVVVANLAPRPLRGVTSHGMILAAGDKGAVDLISVDAKPGEVVR
jgi:methionyl-tRNA synthetase